MYTQQGAIEHAIRNTISLYINKNQMFTVYQIWSDTQAIVKSRIDYNFVRKIVESIINDDHSLLSEWTRTVGNHLRNLDNRVGKVGEAPQIYHRIDQDVEDYDPNFRLRGQKTVNTKPAKAVVEQPTSHPRGLIVESPIKTKKGLFKFKVWANGSLVNCSLVNPRGQGGKFLSNSDYEGHGILDNGVPVLVRQDNEGKLYAITQN